MLKTLQKFLGDDYSILASVGHIRDLPKNDLGVDPDEWFEKKDKHTAPKPEWKNPLDSMPVANGNNRYAPPEKMAELEAADISRLYKVVKV